jgi:hypothetical protein
LPIPWPESWDHDNKTNRKKNYESQFNKRFN